MARNGNGISKMRRLHRGLGALGAVFLLWMAASGIVINHADALGLASRQVAAPLLLDWYGLEGPRRMASYRVGGDWLSFAGSQLYFNGKAAMTLAEGVGAVRTTTMIVAGGRREVLLLDHQARLVERLPWTNEGDIANLGLYDGGVVVRTADQLWLADKQLIGWRPLDASATDVSWSAPQAAPADVHDKVVASYRGQGLSLQRVLLDTHSGRFFGRAGVWAYDLLALLVVLLAGSGLVLRFRSGAKKNRNKRR